MSAVLEPKVRTEESGLQPSDMSSKLAFSKKLQAVTNRIHSTTNIDEIMLDVARDICQLFDADRLTIYTMSEDGAAIISKVKSGLNSFKDIKLPLSESSIAGCCALNKRFMNIKDVYDDAELKSFSAKLSFLKAVDQRTGYRTKQMMVAPIMGVDASGGSGELAGVIQVINHLPGIPFPQLAEEGVVELAKTLAIAFKVRQQIPSAVKSKFDYLVVDNIISEGELELATRTARRKNKNVEDILIDEFQVKEAALGAALAKYFAVDYEPHKSDRIKPADLLKNLKREYCEKANWVPIDEAKSGIIVMTTDPEHVKNSRVVENIFPKSKAVYRVTTAREFALTLSLMFGGGGDGLQTADIGDLLSSLDDDPELQETASHDISAAADNELVKLVNKIIVDAYNQGASDIHIEPLPGKGKTGVRFRRDGSLAPYIEIPSSYRDALAARLKIMCDLDISEKRKPQDGKIKFKKYGPLDIELRVATIPTTGGVEDIVMRILAAGEPIPLDKLGLTTKNKDALIGAISKPYGLFFVCGPTGSGKTTTLHSVLGSLNTPDTKIWTAEDPVEITQKGLRQVQVNKKVVDFPAVMKAFLRADPDIIMVGEMRDAETTHIGIEASLTGHLVFATLHTNSAPEAVIRLLDMGMDPFNFADALVGILAQRLAKRLCKCKAPYTPDGDEMKQFMQEYTSDLRQTPPWIKDPQGEAKKLYEYWLKEYSKDGKLTLYKPVGCDACGGSGYKGRVGLHELMVASDPVKKLIQERARVADLFVKCVEENMSTLKMDGMEKVMMGLTDMKQVRAVCVK
ncbi:MAG: GspE/PulE family protein [Betaproteobacteria bacterium]|jgi:type II secretory ATPase GspE/PulE/Tfp pilus assembly ATPase PilB-like protein|nr:GspE/PulE family protein [Betaproteobacteria bacterium]